MFRKTSFGNFLDIKFQSQLLNHIIRHQYTLTKDDELWFNFEGTIAKFGIKEFEAITGMNCGPLPLVHLSMVKGKFLSKYFKNEDSISRSRVAFLFNESKKLKRKIELRWLKYTS